MTSLLGYVILAGLLALLSSGVLSPVWLLAPRAFPSYRRPRLMGLLLVTPLGMIALWYLIPLIVWGVLGRPSH